MSKYVRIGSISKKLKKTLAKVGISAEKQKQILNNLLPRARTRKGGHSHITALKNLVAELVPSIDTAKVSQDSIDRINGYLDHKDRSRSLGEKTLLLVEKIRKHVYQARSLIRKKNSVKN